MKKNIGAIYICNAILIYTLALSSQMTESLDYYVVVVGKAVVACIEQVKFVEGCLFQMFCGQGVAGIEYRRLERGKTSDMSFVAIAHPCLAVQQN